MRLLSLTLSLPQGHYMTSFTKNAPLTSVTVRDILWYKCLQINVSSWFAKSLHQTVLGTSQRHHSTYAPEGKGTNGRACHHIMARSKTLRGVRRRVWEFSSARSVSNLGNGTVQSLYAVFHCDDQRKKKGPRTV